MRQPVLVDTDVLVGFLRGRSPAVKFVRDHVDRIILSAIVVAELYAGVKGERELAALDEIAALFRVVPVTSELARAAGLHKRDYGPSHGIGLADAIIAATAEAESAELATLNVRHFPMRKGLKPAYARG